MYKLCFYVPEIATALVKKALFEAGAGKIGDYDSCCWQTLGNGQFRPLDNSNPYIGQKGKIETVTEYKVEMVCDDQYIKAAIAALKKAHPYEEPAFDVCKLENI
ncbi:MAG: NGG1p interacting factor NIF3 [Gammaproteobacteria bacterium]|nr:NGG1p interacting factor NIF3 [Gammaproteobacteria bacterium]